jgi:cathepsin F
MKRIISLALVVLALGMVSASFEKVGEEQIFAQFQDFMKNHKKSYNTVEEFKNRFEIFRQNYRKVEMHQFMMSKSGEKAMYELGINEFFDLTPSEFAKSHLNLEISYLQRLKAEAVAVRPHFKNGNAPESYDWRDQGKVSSVKNQGMCGSCWAFSAIGNIESVYAIKTGKNVDFSEQQLVDCDKVDQGCNGGLMEDAFKYLNTSGVMTNQDYPYRGTDGQCRFDQSKVAARVSGFQFASSQDENEIKQFLFENGPLAIAINATPLQFYFWGIFNPWFEWICNPKELNHGVLLVGYGVSGSTPYWIVKNSWGSGWGEKGYFRIIAGKGACGVNTYVVTANVEDSLPTEI